MRLPWASYKKNATNSLVEKKSASFQERKFSFGSEWLYYKLYCGVKSADKILLEGIKPLAEELLRRGIIDKWFFIRYNDPAFHIRLRFHIKDLDKIVDAVLLIRNHLLPFEEGTYIWKLQLDTYNREIERYGENTIELAETLFYYDSATLLKMLELTWGDERERLRWIWGMKSVDELLNVFRFTVEDKLSLLTHLKDAFATEFNMDKLLKTQLNNKYRENRKRIEQFFDTEDNEHNEYFPLIQILQERNESIAPIVSRLQGFNKNAELQVNLGSLLGSYIHMLLNRISTSNPRLHELVIYDFLFRHYQSLTARAKNKIAEENNVVTI